MYFYTRVCNSRLAEKEVSQQNGRHYATIPLRSARVRVVKDRGFRNEDLANEKSYVKDKKKIGGNKKKEMRIT